MNDTSCGCGCCATLGISAQQAAQIPKKVFFCPRHQRKNIQHFTVEMPNSEDDFLLHGMNTFAEKRRLVYASYRSLLHLTHDGTFEARTFFNDYEYVLGIAGRRSEYARDHMLSWYGLSKVDIIDDLQVRMRIEKGRRCCRRCVEPKYSLAPLYIACQSSFIHLYDSSLGECRVPI
jgi:hypothetical protein